jgi:hypothetical protein
MSVCPTLFLPNGASQKNPAKANDIPLGATISENFYFCCCVHWFVSEANDFPVLPK